jgi:glycerophosphoryl diester phosphodiesterase
MRALLLATALLLAACAMPAGTPVRHFDLQGHRGARGLAPENSLAAFTRALDLGVTTLELDIGVTRDGVVMVHHDERLNPNFTRDAQGAWITQPTPRIRDLTAAEVASYNIGQLKPGTAYANQFPEQGAREREAIPRLADLFELVKQRGHTRVRFNIETKLTPDKPDDTVGPDAMAAALLRAIAEHGMEGRVSIQSFDWRTLRLVQAQRPAIPTVCLTARYPNFNTVSPAWNAGLRLEGGSLPELAKRAGCAIWSPNFQDVDSAAVASARIHELQVIPWTVNRREDIARLIELNVDGLISDRPDLALAELKARNIKVR